MANGRSEQTEAQESRSERSKKRRKRQAEQQEQERLQKLQKLKEPGVPLADFASEIVEVESLNFSEAEQVKRRQQTCSQTNKKLMTALHKQRLLIIYVC